MSAISMVDFGDDAMRCTEANNLDLQELVLWLKMRHFG